MNVRSTLLAAAALTMLTPAAISAPQDKDALAALDAKLPGTLINDPTRLDWPVNGGAQVKSVRDASIPGGGAAMQIAVQAANAQQPWTVQVSIPLTAKIDKGADVVIGFYARTIASDASGGDGVIGVRFQQNSAPYPGFGDKTVKVGKDWQFYQVSATADRDIAKGDGIVSLQLAGARQTLEIGQAIVVSGATSLTGTAPATAQATGVPMPDGLAAKGTLINDPANRNWGTYGAAITATPMKAGLPGGAATHFDVTAAQANAYDSGVAIPIRDAIHAGDTLIVALILRGEPKDPTDKAAVAIRVQKNETGYPGFGDHDLPIAAKWQMLQVPMHSNIDIPAGKAQVVLQLGGAAQTIDVGPVYVLHAN